MAFEKLRDPERRNVPPFGATLSDCNKLDPILGIFPSFRRVFLSCPSITLKQRSWPRRQSSIGDVLVKESWKEGVRDCFHHFGELVTDIRDDSLDKLPFVLQRSLQAGIG
jgi:hypothetical protein